MPFYAKDWRSPGESWIKTEDGWEKLKVLETNRKRLITDDGVFYRLVILSASLLFVCVYIFCCYDVYLLHWSACYLLSNDTSKANGEASLLLVMQSSRTFLWLKSEAKSELRLVLFQGRRFSFFFFFFFSSWAKITGCEGAIPPVYSPCVHCREILFDLVYPFQFLHSGVRDGQYVVQDSLAVGQFDCDYFFILEGEGGG
jgi:hypothetical protein